MEPTLSETKPSFDEALAAAIRPHLAGDETLVWVGRPRQGFAWSRRFLFAILFPLGPILAGTAFFLSSFSDSATHDPLILIPRLIGLGVFALGIAMTVGTVGGDARRRRETLYAVTDRRVIIVSGQTRFRIKSVLLQTMSDLQLNEGHQGFGTITFGPRNPFESTNLAPPWPFSEWMSTSSFDELPRAREVFHLIGKVQRAAG